MKRTITIIMAMFGVVALSFSDEIREKILTVQYTTNTTAQVTTSDTTVNGYIEQITIDVPDVTTMTNIVNLVAVDKTGATIPLATNALTGDKVYRPVFSQTDVNGNTNSSFTRFLLLGETLRLSVTNVVGGSVSMSNATFRAIIKTSR